MSVPQINIAVTGGRFYSDINHVYRELDAARIRYGDFVLLVGDAIGVDRFAKDWAEDRNVLFREFEAKWKKYGKSAGPIRNREMVASADKLLAFPGGKGTRDCVTAAKHLGIEVEYV